MDGVYVCQAREDKLLRRNLMFDLENELADCQNAKVRMLVNSPLPRYAGNVIQGRALASLKWTTRQRRSIEKRSTATFRSG